MTKSISVGFFPVVGVMARSLLCSRDRACIRNRLVFFFSSRRRHTRWTGDWSSDVCSSDLPQHTHTLTVAGGPATTSTPSANTMLAQPTSGELYAMGGADTGLSAVSAYGGSQPDRKSVV